MQKKNFGWNDHTKSSQQFAVHFLAVGKCSLVCWSAEKCFAALLVPVAWHATIVANHCIHEKVVVVLISVMILQLACPTCVSDSGSDRVISHNSFAYLVNSK